MNVIKLVLWLRRPYLSAVHVSRIAVPYYDRGGDAGDAVYAAVSKHAIGVRFASPYCLPVIDRFETLLDDRHCFT